MSFPGMQTFSLRCKCRIEMEPVARKGAVGATAFLMDLRPTLELARSPANRTTNQKPGILGYSTDDVTSQPLHHQHIAMNRL